jgi:hypothetical protein
LDYILESLAYGAGWKDADLSGNHSACTGIDPLSLEHFRISKAWEIAWGHFDQARKFLLLFPPDHLHSFEHSLFNPILFVPKVACCLR